MSDDLFEGVGLETPENVDTTVKDKIVTDGRGTKLVVQHICQLLNL